VNVPSRAINTEKWDQTITPARGFFDIGLGETWRYRELIWVLVRRDFVSVYKQTVLGPIWFVLQPLATTMVFVLLFGRVAKIPTGGTPPFLFYLSGLVMWNFFSSSFSKTSDIFGTNAGIFAKVYFPRLVVPVSVVVSNLLTFAIQFALFIVLMVGSGHAGSPLSMLKALALMVPLICFVGLLGLGVGIGVSSLTTRFRDLGYLSGFVVQLWMYATPVIYPTTIVPEQLKFIPLINPMTGPVETFRHLWLGTNATSVLNWEIGFVVMSVLLLIGLLLFSQTQKISTDTV
jgi:lipopolysaccharide transport system permease protein